MSVVTVKLGPGLFHEWNPHGGVVSSSSKLLNVFNGSVASGEELTISDLIINNNGLGKTLDEEINGNNTFSVQMIKRQDLSCKVWLLRHRGKGSQEIAITDFSLVDVVDSDFFSPEGDWGLSATMEVVVLLGIKELLWSVPFNVTPGEAARVDTSPEVHVFTVFVLEGVILPLLARADDRLPINVLGVSSDTLPA